MPINPRANKAKASGDRSRVAQSVSNFKAETDEPAAEEPPQPVVTPTEPVTDPVADASTAETDAAPEVNEDRPRRPVEPHVAEPISYWELPQGIRDDLPEIKITVLVFAEHPGDRFLLSNGQRLVEKDELDGGLVLDEIRKDGAIFLYRNYRFLVKS